MNPVYKKYSRGQIIRVNFGNNLGSEFSKNHYAIVISKRDNIRNPVLHVIPLTSKSHNHNILIENVIYDPKQMNILKAQLKIEKNSQKLKDLKKCLHYYEALKNKQSYLCIKHLKTISKLAISGYYNYYDALYLTNLKVNDQILNLIDQEIIKEYTKRTVSSSNQ